MVPYKYRLATSSNILLGTHAIVYNLIRMSKNTLKHVVVDVSKQKMYSTIIFTYKNQTLCDNREF